MAVANLGSPDVDLWVETSGIDHIFPPGELPNAERWQTWFQVWLRELNPAASPISRYEVSLLLTDDSTIQNLNSTYRHQNRATDVLAFAAQETQIPAAAQAIYQTAPLPLGDVIISVETAQRQRHDVNYSLTQELAWLATHGLLHLLGWDHPDDTSLQTMLDQQAQLLQSVEI